MILLALMGCETTLAGAVVDVAGAPLAGASVDAGEACRAVTDAGGRFRVRCERGAYTFRVTHPDCIDGSWPITAEERGDVAVGSFSLARIPTADGLHLLNQGHFSPIAPAPLRRAEDADREQRWCLDPAAGAPTEVPAGDVRVLDNHTADWRLYRLDADGCAYRLRRGGGEHWSFTADRVLPTATTPVSEGRAWVDLALSPGDYVLAEWYEGFLVRADAETWQASWLRTVGP